MGRNILIVILLLIIASGSIFLYTESRRAGPDIQEDSDQGVMTVEGKAAPAP